jgi:hypothetical protein
MYYLPGALIIIICLSHGVMLKNRTSYFAFYQSHLSSNCNSIFYFKIIACKSYVWIISQLKLYCCPLSPVSHDSVTTVYGNKEYNSWRPPGRGTKLDLQFKRSCPREDCSQETLSSLPHTLENPSPWVIMRWVLILDCWQAAPHLAVVREPNSENCPLVSIIWPAVDSQCDLRSHLGVF